MASGANAVERGRGFEVAGGDIRITLETQAGATLALLRRISDDASLRRYAPDKWSIRQVVCHINDAERVFVLRALWFKAPIVIWAFQSDPGVPGIIVNPVGLRPQSMYEVRSLDVGPLGVPVGGCAHGGRHWHRHLAVQRLPRDRAHRRARSVSAQATS